MRSVVRGAIRDEKGNVFILVLILLVVGGLILTPLLGLMSTGLIAGQVYEKKMQEYYAADAGIEDALWKIQHDIEIPTDGYSLTVNNKYVWVTLNGTDTELFLANLLGVDPKHWGHSNWTVIGKTPEAGIAEITITWNGEGNEFLTDVGIWLSGNYSYVEGQTIPDDDIRDQYPDCTFEQKAYSGGMGFIWTWPNANQANGPSFNEDNHTATLIFQFEPESIPDLAIAFTMAGRQDVGLTYDSRLALYTITATAISDTGTATADIESHTTVVARVVTPESPCDEDEIEVLNWNIS